MSSLRVPLAARELKGLSERNIMHSLTSEESSQCPPPFLKAISSSFLTALPKRGVHSQEPSYCLALEQRKEANNARKERREAQHQLCSLLPPFKGVLFFSCLGNNEEGVNVAECCVKNCLRERRRRSFSSPPFDIVARGLSPLSPFYGKGNREDMLLCQREKGSTRFNDFLINLL